MFRRRTIWIVHIAMIASALGLFFWSLGNRTALLTPIEPDLHAIVIGLAVFIGVLVAAAEREAWLLDIGSGWRSPPRGLGAIIGMLALIGASGFAGDFLAGQIWEWQAFHGIHPASSDYSFTVLARHSSRSGEWLELQSLPDIPPFLITCSYATYNAVNPGDRLILTVEKGRKGVERVTLPPLPALRRS